MRSIVVEIKNDYAAVLSDDGSITKVRNRNYVIGQVITMKNQKIHITKKVAIGVASAALVLTTGVGAWAYTTPTSYVSLDVNPSIEYTLNTFDRVIDVNAVNDDGQAIVDEIDINSLENQPIEEAIVSTVEQISQDGYFDGDTATAVSGSAISGSAIEVTDTTGDTTTTDGTVVDDSTINGGIIITTSNENSDVSDDLANELQDAVEDVVGDDVVVEALSVGLERVQEAKELGVTPGKLNLVQKLQASSADPDSVSLEEWLNKPVKEIMKAIKVNKKADSAKNTEDDANVEETTETEAVQESTAAVVEDADDNDDNTALVSSEKTKKVEKAEKVKTKTTVKANKEQTTATEETKETQEKAKKAQEKAIEVQEKANEKAKEETEAAVEKAKKAQENANEKAKEANENTEKAAKESQEKVKENQGKK